MPKVYFIYIDGYRMVVGGPGSGRLGSGYRLGPVLFHVPIVFGQACYIRSGNQGTGCTI